MPTPTTTDLPARTNFLWLDLTRKCQLSCDHCYNASGPSGTHGRMTRGDWFRVLDQAAEAGVRRVQFIGGEPTMHPYGLDLVRRALRHGLQTEVYSNLVHVSEAWWEVLHHLTLATSYYSDDPARHNAMTNRPSHGRTRANIERAVRAGIPLRVSVITADDDLVHLQRIKEELRGLGVERIGVDRVRPFGRGAPAAQAAPNRADLCGRCGDERAAIGPEGDVSPCVFSTWTSVGNVLARPLADILAGPELATAHASVRTAMGPAAPCNPNPEPCEPDDPCGPDDEECTPGFPGSVCSPRN